MLVTFLGFLQYAAAVVFIAYLISSFQSAIRMAMVHDRYAHIEFNQTKWREFGQWAPQRMRFLARLRYAAIVALPLWVVAGFLKGLVL